MKIIHLASFNGNVGDNINHAGFRPWFQRLIKKKISWQSLEIREFYWKKRNWDKKFVDLVNNFDLLVIGGGNYFELWLDNSPTGTSIAIPLNLFKKIRIPIFFNSLGVDLAQGSTKLTKTKFKKFLDLILCDEKNIISIRNDGSKKNLEKIYGVKNLKKINYCPDHGFFIEKKFYKKKKKNYRVISINLACDMPEIRFKHFGNKKTRIQNFCKEMSLFICKLCNNYENLIVYLIPHIYSDLQVYNEILKFLPDDVRRKKIFIGEFGSGSKSAIKTLEYYLRSDLVLGTRFHSNVSSIGLLKDTIGLKNFPQIEYLYDEIGQSKSVIDISKPIFKSKLFKKVKEVFDKTKKSSFKKKKDIIRSKKR